MFLSSSAAAFRPRGVYRKEVPRFQRETPFVMQIASRSDAKITQCVTDNWLAFSTE